LKHRTCNNEQDKSIAIIKPPTTALNWDWPNAHNSNKFLEIKKGHYLIFLSMGLDGPCCWWWLGWDGDLGLILGADARSVQYRRMGKKL
jgi:hypothetical protein